MIVRLSVNNLLYIERNQRLEYYFKRAAFELFLYKFWNYGKLCPLHDYIIKLYIYKIYKFANFSLKIHRIQINYFKYENMYKIQ